MKINCTHATLLGFFYAFLSTARVVPCSDQKLINFELWNKSKKPLYFIVYTRDQASAKNTALQTVNPLTELPAGKRYQTSLDITQVTGLLISPIAKPQIGTRFTIYEFRPGNTIYVRAKSLDEPVGPQTGRFKGVLGQTESGLPLHNNVSAKDINYYEFAVIADEDTGKPVLQQVKEVENFDPKEIWQAPKHFKKRKTELLDVIKDIGF